MVGQKTLKSVKNFPLENLGYTVDQYILIKQSRN